MENLDPFPNMSQKEIKDYLWNKSTEIEPKGNDPAIKKKIAVRAQKLISAWKRFLTSFLFQEGKPKWKGMSLRSPGIKPKNLPGKSHPPHPLPRIRQSSRSQNNNNDGGNTTGDETSSPLTSPIFRNSPASGPSTPVSNAPLPSSPPAGTELDPVKMTVMLPYPNSASNAISSNAVANASGPIPSPGLPPSLNSFSMNSNGPPPPLPPKPSKMLPPTPSASSSSASFAALTPCDHPPAVPHRQNSSPPPPLPPRRDHMTLNSRGLNPSGGDASGWRDPHRMPPPPLTKR